ncbi:MAG: hypothetical protein IPP77_09535 [Bacteroidetes bacterium]|nr:hypothetical protein [Bacteroidota bacterium]
MTWQARKQVYQSLKANPSLIDSAANGWQFYNTIETTNIGKLTQMEELIGEAMTPDSVILVQLMVFQGQHRCGRWRCNRASTRTRLAAGRFKKIALQQRMMALYGGCGYTEGCSHMDNLLYSLMSYLISDTSTPEAPDSTNYHFALNNQIYFIDSGDLGLYR